MRASKKERILRASGWRPYTWRVRKSVHSLEYQLVLKHLVAMRKAAGLTQRELAKRLKREYSFIWRIETGERRLDVVEFFWLCRALDKPAAAAYAALVAEWDGASGMPGWGRAKVAESRPVYRIRRKAQASH